MMITFSNFAFCFADFLQPPKIDVEGYSERPDSLDEISRIQREAAAYVSSLLFEGFSTDLQTISTEEPGLNLTIRDQPIEEDESEAKMALNEVANTLRLVSRVVARYLDTTKLT